MTPSVLDIADTPVDRLPPLVRVEPLPRPFHTAVRPPGSKSLTNRLLPLAALARGTSVLRGALADAEDARVMIAALRRLGAVIDAHPEHDDQGRPTGNATLRVTGVDGRWKIAPGATVTLDLANAGTATRFLTAAAMLMPSDAGGIVIDGHARMRQRPIGDLVDAMRGIGVRVEWLGAPGFPPLRVLPVPRPEDLGVNVLMPTGLSGQFISALMLAAPFLPRGLHIQMRRPVTSASYVRLTERALRSAGLRIGDGLDTGPDLRAVRIWGTGERRAPALAPGTAAWFAPYPVLPLPAFELDIEPDPSGLAFFLVAAGVVKGSSLLVEPAWVDDALERVDLADPAAVGTLLDMRADLRRLVLADGPWPAQSIAKACSAMGLIAAIDDGADLAAATFPVGPFAFGTLDLADIPDETMALAVLAAFASPSNLGGPPGGTTTRFTGLRTLRVKETDRLAALETELAKVGVSARAFSGPDHHGHPDEGLTITPPPGGLDRSPNTTPVTFDTYGDHRMAMSLALIGLRRPGVTIRDPACVGKTYPTFWRDLASLYR